MNKLKNRTEVISHLNAIIDLCECDDTLFNDGIELDIKQHAQEAIELVKKGK